MKKLLIVFAILALGACAKAAPPIPVEIPIGLVNTQALEMEPMQAMPDVDFVTGMSLGSLVEAYIMLWNYSDQVTTRHNLLEADDVLMRKKLHQIKKYILLQQANSPPI